VKGSALVIATAIPYSLNSRNRIVYNKTGNAPINVIVKIALETIVAVEEQ
jgi:hypothetical protein